MNDATRHIAANRIMKNGYDLGRCVVSLKGDVVLDCQPLLEELPMTEWFGGTIHIVTDEKDIHHAIFE